MVVEKKSGSVTSINR